MRRWRLARIQSVEEGLLSVGAHPLDLFGRLDGADLLSLVHDHFLTCFRFLNDLVVQGNEHLIGILRHVAASAEVLAAS